jgi:hypothetical protein
MDVAAVVRGGAAEGESHLKVGREGVGVASQTSAKADAPGLRAGLAS